MCQVLEGLWGSTASFFQRLSGAEMPTQSQLRCNLTREVLVSTTDYFPLTLLEMCVPLLNSLKTCDMGYGNNFYHFVTCSVR